MCAAFLPQIVRWDMNSLLMTLAVGDFCCQRALSVFWAGPFGCSSDGCSSFCYKGWKEGLFGNQPGQDLAYFGA